MKCPYCLSDTEDQALVCKVCTRDIHLFRPLLARIAALEEQVAATPGPSAHEERIRALEDELAQAHALLYPPRPAAQQAALNLLVFLLLPLGLLLLSHWVITIALDVNLLYLRVISIAVPLPFGLALFLRPRQSVLPWFGATVVLAGASVIGMSWLTSLVDQTPVLPQNAFEWREYLEYAASIALSFLTGMLLGQVLRSRRHRAEAAKGSLVASLMGYLVGGNLTPKQLAALVKKVEEFGGSMVAIGTTVMSVYTGLKGVLGN